MTRRGRETLFSSYLPHLLFFFYSIRGIPRAEPRLIVLPEFRHFFGITSPSQLVFQSIKPKNFECTNKGKAGENLAMDTEQFQNIDTDLIMFCLQQNCLIIFASQ